MSTRASWRPIAGGILTATTLMANGDAFDDAVRLARETPTLDIGCHLVLIGGRSLAGRQAATGVRAATAGGAGAARDPAIRGTARRRFGASWRRASGPRHLDTHKHTHLAPPVLDAVARLAEEFGIRWVRRPFDFPLNALRGAVPRMKRWTSDALGLMRRRFHRVLARHGCRTTDHFAGFQITGRFRTEELVALMGVIPEGSTELMCHPGHCGDALRDARTRLKESRVQELEAWWRRRRGQRLQRHGIELVNYRGLDGRALESG